MSSWLPVNEACDDDPRFDGLRCGTCGTLMCSHGFEPHNESNGMHHDGAKLQVVAVHHPDKLHHPDPALA